LQYKVLFMDTHNQQLEAIAEIRHLMQRSSRFLSLSGLSGVAAGCWALVGAWFAHDWIQAFHASRPEGAAYETGELSLSSSLGQLKLSLLLLAAAVLGAALISALYFTWRRAGRQISGLWNPTSRKLLGSLLVPLVAGGFFILALLQEGSWRFVVPASLVFYGLALVSGGKYTLSEIRYLGYTELVLGLISTQFPGEGLYFWAAGFGLLHIFYGFAMWWKYERKPEMAEA
jgi:hypothetical protein